MPTNYFMFLAERDILYFKSVCLYVMYLKEPLGILNFLVIVGL